MNHRAGCKGSMDEPNKLKYVEVMVLSLCSGVILAETGKIYVKFGNLYVFLYASDLNWS